MTLLQTNHPSELGTVWRMVTEGTLSTQIIMAVLAVLSLTSWSLILWKVLQFRRTLRDSELFHRKVGGTTSTDDAYELVRTLRESAFTRVFRRGLGFFRELRPSAAKVGTEVRGLSPAQLEVLRIVLEKEEGDERDNLARGLGWLAIMATASPLLGLLGTVIGVMNSFIGVSTAGSSSITVVAPGIAEALVATAGGLVVAIPAAMAYNYLTAQLNRLMGELEGVSSELIGTLAREGRI
jgi:biopolymer transport protein TolQ